MKKSLFVAGILFVLGLFAIVPQQAEANVLAKGAPAVAESFTLNSGQAKVITVGSFRSTDFISKYVVKFKVESDQKESIMYEEYFDHGYHSQLNDRRFFYTNSTEAIYKNLLDEEVKGVASGTRSFKIINYSAKSVKISFGVNSSIHPTAIPCTDYTDIDFTLP